MEAVIRAMAPILKLPRNIWSYLDRSENPFIRFLLQPMIRYFLVTVVLFIVLLFVPVIIIVALIPVTPLLLMLPSILPEETVLTETNNRSGFFGGLTKRTWASIAGLIALVVVSVFGVELLRYAPLPSANPLMTQLADTVSGLPVSKYLPAHIVGNWPILALLVYFVDFLMLAILLRVPLSYNYRNLMVRWWVTLLVSFCFAVVIMIVTVALSFVNGMYKLTESTGKKGNILILADGATDEQFSNMAYSDVSTVQEKYTKVDEYDQPLRADMPIVRIASKQVGDRTVYLCSQETLIFVNQPRAVADGVKRRRFIQMRGVVDPVIAAEVHGIELAPGSRWFSDAGVNDEREIECVLGEGIAAQLAEDTQKKMLEIGDTFEMSDRTWKVVGLIKSLGSTFGSEVWAKQSLVGPMFNKNSYSSIVIRTEPDTQEAATILAYHLRTRESPKMNAITEIEYYSRLQETNKQFLYAILAVAVIMALGGVFGVMVAMFAAITRRTKDIGVMRILGFKRWQLLVSFLVESLAIAIVGGIIGVILGWLVADGRQASSIVSSGQGGGKTVALTLSVDGYVILTGLLIALIMGRLGGMIPALTTLRLKILDAIRS